MIILYDTTQRVRMPTLPLSKSNSCRKFCRRRSATATPAAAAAAAAASARPAHRALPNVAVVHPWHPTPSRQLAQELEERPIMRCHLVVHELVQHRQNQSLHRNKAATGAVAQPDADLFAVLKVHPFETRSARQELLEDADGPAAPTHLWRDL